MTRKLNAAVCRIGIWLALGITVVWTAFPIWWAVAFSFKRSGDFFAAKTIPYLQFQPTLANWRAEWRIFLDPTFGIGRSLLGSVVVASGTAVVSLSLGLFAAVGLVERERSRRRNWPFVALVLLPRVVPPVLIAFPFSLIMLRLRLDDTWTALVIAHATLALPLTILVLYGSLRQVPYTVVEAARLDGAGWPRLVWQIIVPLLRPVIVATGTLAFALSWNEFLFAVTNLSQHADTAPLVVASLVNKDGIEFEYVGGHLVLVMLPPLIIGLAAQRYVVRGLTLGAIID